MRTCRLGTRILENYGRRNWIDMVSIDYIKREEKGKREKFNSPHYLQSWRICTLEGPRPYKMFCLRQQQ
jgi:hypothetical protein